MALAEVLRVTHSIRDGVKVVDGKVESVEDKVEGMSNKVQSVDDKVQIVIDGMPGVSVESPINSNFVFQTARRREWR